MPNSPKKKKVQRSPGQTQISITLSEEMLARLEFEAKEREQTVSGFCRFLFNEYFKAKSEVPPGKFPPSRSQAYHMNDKPGGK